MSFKYEPTSEPLHCEGWAHQRRRSGEALKSDTAPIVKMELRARMGSGLESSAGFE